MSIEIESEQVPREFYGLVASLNDLLVESEVPQCYIDRALDKIESIIAQALNHAVNLVWRSEHRRLSAAGDYSLERTRFDWLRHPVTFTRAGRLRILSVSKIL